MESNKLTHTVENLPKAKEIIHSAGLGDKIKKIKDVHFGEIIKLANTIIDKQNQNGITQ